MATTTAPGRNTLRKSNGRSPLRASRIRPDLITIRPDEPVTVACPDCGGWMTLRRGGMIRPHRSTDGHVRDERCPGSGQLIDLDLTPEQWGRRLVDASADAGKRRARNGGVHRMPKRDVAPAVSQMKATTAPLRYRLAEHQATCPKCQTAGHRCERADMLRRNMRRLAVWR